MPFKMGMELKEEFIWKYPLPFPVTLRKKNQQKQGNILCVCAMFVLVVVFLEEILWWSGKSEMISFA